VEREYIAPNEFTRMLVTFKSGKRSGETKKKVAVTTDQKPRGQYNVRIKAFVESPTARPPKFYADPRSLEFRPPKNKYAGEGSVKLVNENEYELQVNIVYCTEDIGAAKLTKKKLKAGQSGELVFEFNDQDARKPVYGSVTLETISDEKVIRRYTVPIIRQSPSSWSPE
jgi:hypothetical protein